MTNKLVTEQAFKRLGLLSSSKILICRPEPSATELSKALEALGAQCKTLPMLKIDALEISAIERQHILDLDQYQHVIVVSQHAADLGLEQIDHYWPQAPVGQKWYAIGRKTAEALNSTSLDIVSPGQDLSSEKLLENKDLKTVQDEKILILKGKHGRQALQSQLLARGAQVDSISLYQRSKPDYDQSILQQSIDDFAPDFIITLSGETLTNLLAHCSEHNIDLSDRSFILPSIRVANIAYEHGLKNTLISENLMPMDIVKCIKKASL